MGSPEIVVSGGSTATDGRGAPVEIAVSECHRHVVNTLTCPAGAGAVASRGSGCWLLTVWAVSALAAGHGGASAGGLVPMMTTVSTMPMAVPAVMLAHCIPGWSSLG